MGKKAWRRLQSRRERLPGPLLLKEMQREEKEVGELGGGAWKRRVALAVKAHGVLRAGAFA